jgi:excisionase family DNA binding protein
MSQILRADELAELLGVTRPTVHTWHRRGWVPGLRAGRRPVLFDLDAVLRSLERRAASSAKAARGGEPQ